MVDEIGFLVSRFKGLEKTGSLVSRFESLEAVVGDLMQLGEISPAAAAVCLKLFAQMEEEIGGKLSETARGQFWCDPAEPAKGHVYILWAINTQYYKIGQTKKLTTRIEQIQPRMPFKSKLVHTKCTLLQATIAE